MDMLEQRYFYYVNVPYICRSQARIYSQAVEGVRTTEVLCFLLYSARHLSLVVHLVPVLEYDGVCRISGSATSSYSRETQ